MIDRKDGSRREFLTWAGAVGTALVASKAVAQNLRTTPTQAEGPFYPVVDQIDKDANMRRVIGRAQEAIGEKVQIQGSVIDADTGKPIENAIVEFWQACASGRYNHPDDTNDSPLDPYFQYWAQVRTNAQGEYSLKTIKPGAYPASATWIRPPHIHVKVHRLGYPSLTTQLYFAGEDLNASDRILQGIPRDIQPMVVVNLEQTETESVGSWNIYIAKSIQSLRKGNHRITPEIND